jgi:hypothetical protein
MDRILLSRRLGEEAGRPPPLHDFLKPHAGTEQTIAVGQQVQIGEGLVVGNEPLVGAVNAKRLPDHRRAIAEMHPHRIVRRGLQHRDLYLLYPIQRGCLRTRVPCFA